MTLSNRRILPCLLLLLLSLPSWSLDLEDGNVKLTLQEGIGRFSLYSLSGQKEGKQIFVPLLAAQDPRTTVLSIVVGNKVYRMGESSEFTETLQKSAAGASFTWKSTRLVVIESFSFIPAVGSALSQGVRIDITLRNVSPQDLVVGVRYLFDTYLGEPSLVHFKTDALPSVTRELSLTGNNRPAYWVSPLSGDASQLGLQCMTSGKSITVPDGIVFANWKRLNDASWSFQTSAARDFSLLPYSTNDSAVCHYYDPGALARGSEKTITLVMGKYSPTGLSAEPAVPESRTAALSPQEAAEQKRISEAIAALRTEISAVNTFLSGIDTKVSLGGALTDQDVATLEAALAELKKRAAKYGTGFGK